MCKILLLQSTVDTVYRSLCSVSTTYPDKLAKFFALCVSYRETNNDCHSGNFKLSIWPFLETECLSLVSQSWMLLIWKKKRKHGKEGRRYKIKNIFLRQLFYFHHFYILGYHLPNLRFNQILASNPSQTFPSFSLTQVPCDLVSNFLLSKENFYS
jgi:hypothetical protein